MITKNQTQKLEGSMMMFNPDTRVLQRGNLVLMLDEERAMVHVKNDVTGIETLEYFDSPDQRYVIEWLMWAIEQTHTDVDVGISTVTIDTVDCTCNGLGETQNADGDWIRCKACEGA